MNTNPIAKRILCFGDSNVWGKIPGAGDEKERYEIDKRWTGILQNLLGDGYEIIEEGLNGRTTNIDSPYKAGKKGTDYLFSCLGTHRPIDLIILYLGKNDLKTHYNRSVTDVTKGLEECIELIKIEGKDKQGKMPKVIILSPTIIEEKERERFGNKVVDFLGAKEKSKILVEEYAKLAEKHNLEYVDLSKLIEVSELDGVHLDETEHKKVADELNKKVRSLF